LERDCDVNDISGSSIGRTLRKLDERGLIRLKGSKLKKKLKPNEINNAKGRDFSHSHSQRWDYKKHNVFNTRHNNLSKMKPGELMQIDHLKLNKNNLRFIEFSAIDPITRYKISHCYNSANSKNAKDFLINKLMKQPPFKAISIQADGGSEFRKHFEEACKELNTPLYVLPPYSPKYNGRIERSNRTIREEFYNSNNLMGHCITVGDFNLELEKYIDKYNNYRPHKELDYLTPKEYYLKFVETGDVAPNVSGL
jgi:transposase InsO family protein